MGDLALLPAMRQQLVDAAVQVGRQARQHILEVSPGIVPVELGRLCRPPNYAEWARFSPDSPKGADDPVGIV